MIRRSDARFERAWMRWYIGPVLYFGVALYAAPVAAAPEPHEQERPVTVQRSTALSTGLSDEAAMVLAGTALIGIAAAVRRAA